MSLEIKDQRKREAQTKIHSAIHSSKKKMILVFDFALTCSRPAGSYGAVRERREGDTIAWMLSISGLNWFSEVKYCIEKSGCLRECRISIILKIGDNV
ncbi:unnamed protein product [Thlaspi arvense]|uniref:Uncharacterized protein n=1 Tax=Thlaspi arvense TaxID=13288 RepID=A0AAU9T5B1_THLAR|nr:unnamed protein product [Thlaspi arvense]